MNIDRIKSNTIVSESGCWVWQRSCNSAGYGQLTENKKYWLAHRYAYACKHPDLLDTDVIRHMCHNPKCCNPEHLKIGTHKDNWKDSESKHLKAAKKQRKSWNIGSTTYSTIREAQKETGISYGSICKYTVDGIFDIEAYREGCSKANVVPKI